MNKKQKTGKHIHLVGIGGSGLSAIAKVLLERGFRVTGSDEQLTQRTADLYAAGATIFKGHRATNISGANMVIVSSAVPEDNPELVAARQAGVPVLKRGALLGSLMANSVGIAVAGSHGKTTTTGMIGQIFIEAELDPTIILGDTLPLIDTNGRSGKGSHFIIEADEYERMFLGLKPQIGVITNIDFDHPDIYANDALYQKAFADFLQLIPAGGCAVLCAEDPHAVNMLKLRNDIKRIAYGIGFPITPTPGLTLLLAQDLVLNEQGGYTFTVEQDLEPIGSISLRIAGEHNVNNALAAIAVALHEGIPFDTIQKALAHFPGIKRRMEVRGIVGQITIIDDYAHHPTEIRSTLQALKQKYPAGRLWAVWQPHTFSRIQSLMGEFATCFKDAQELILLDVFHSRESDSLGLDTPKILSQIKHPSARYVGPFAATTSYLLEHLQPQDVVVTLNAGDARIIGDWVLDGLRVRTAESIINEALPEAIMSDDEQKAEEKEKIDVPENRVAKLDATVSQVQKLVAKLKDEQDRKNADAAATSTPKKDEDKA